MHTCSFPQSCLTLVTPRTVAHQVPLSLGFFRQESWSALPFLLQGIFSTQGSNLHLLCLLNCRQILYLLSHRGSTNNLKVLSTTLPCVPTLPPFWFKCKHFWTLLSIFCSLYIALCFILSQASSHCFYPSKKISIVPSGTGLNSETKTATSLTPSNMFPLIPSLLKEICLLS